MCSYVSHVCVCVFHFTLGKQVYVKRTLREMLHGIKTQLITPAGYVVECCRWNFDVLLYFSELEVECAIQFRRIGDKLNFRQKLLNLISKLFRSGTWLFQKPSNEEIPLIKWDSPVDAYFISWRRDCLMM